MKINRNQIISLRILLLLGQGKSLREAMNAVLGEGTFEKVAGEIYEGHRAKALTSVTA